MKISKQELHLIIDIAKLEMMPGITIINNETKEANKYIWRSIYNIHKLKGIDYNIDEPKIIERVIIKDFNLPIDKEQIKNYKNPIKLKREFDKKSFKHYNEDMSELESEQLINKTMREFAKNYDHRGRRRYSN